MITHTEAVDRNILRRALQKFPAQSFNLDDIEDPEQRTEAKQVWGSMADKGYASISDGGQCGFERIPGFFVSVTEKGREIVKPTAPHAAMPDSKEEELKSEDIPESLLIASYAMALENERDQLLKNNGELVEALEEWVNRFCASNCADLDPDDHWEECSDTRKLLARINPDNKKGTQS